MARNLNRGEKLTDLPNIGAVLAGKLEDAGIRTASDLTTLGSVEALLRIRAGADADAPCANTLYALEGAVRGIRWHAIPRSERDALWRRYRTCIGT